MDVVTGMHRSGTSLLARLFHEAGAPLGDPAGFFRPDKWNPDGYFEPADVRAVNVALVRGPWWKLSYFKLSSPRTVARRARRQAPRIRALSERHEAAIVKDPHFCLTIGVWLDHGAPIRRVIVCIREPIEVASSIRARNKVPERYALTLWHEHNRRLLETLRQRELTFLVVDYHALLEPSSSVAEIQRAFRFFEIERSDEEVRALRDRLVRPELNHQGARDHAYPERIQALWRELRELRHSAAKTGVGGY